MALAQMVLIAAGLAASVAASVTPIETQKPASQDTAQSEIPGGVYSPRVGNVSLCGQEAASLAELDAWIRSTDSLAPGNSDARFEVFDATGQPFRQYVLTRPSEYAHPAITCRLVTENPDGTAGFSREMSCDADKASCDRLFLEFYELDEQLRAELNGKAGRRH